MSALPYIPFIGKIIDKIFPDKESAAEAKLKLFELEQSGELAKLEASAGIIKEEAKSEHWLAANWRPLTMVTFLAIIINNYIIYPYLSLFWAEAPVLELPTIMWELMKIGLGGYVVGRSGEKIVKEWKRYGN